MKENLFQSRLVSKIDIINRYVDRRSLYFSIIFRLQNFLYYLLQILFTDLCGNVFVQSQYIWIYQLYFLFILFLCFNIFSKLIQVKRGQISFQKISDFFLFLNHIIDFMVLSILRILDFGEKFIFKIVHFKQLC